MKRIIWISAFVFPSFASVANAGVVTLSFDPPDIIVFPGDTFTVNLVADIPGPVVGWGLDLTIDAPGVVSVSADPVIAAPPWIAAFAPDGDKLAALADPLTDADGNGVLGSVSGLGIQLATLTLTADSFGLANMMLSTTSGDPTEGFAHDPVGFANLEFNPGHVLVIPEPAAFLPLLVCVLIALQISCRKRRLASDGPSSQ